jgi:isopenicillin-N epimerase
VLDAARSTLAAFLGAEPANLAWVSNATAGVNAVLRSRTFRAGDELLATNHTYNACRNVLDLVATQSGARVVVASVPFPLASSEEVVDSILACVGTRTRFALIDHVTSPTGLVLPIERIVHELTARGVDVMVDGAHAPGMVESISRASARCITPAIATSGCARRRARDSSTSVRTSSRKCGRSPSAMAPTHRAAIARAF